MANVFRVPTGNAELSRAQYDAFAKQIPLLYLLLTTNTIAVATSYVNVAPFWLTVGLPAVLCLMCILRLVKWLNR